MTTTHQTNEPRRPHVKDLRELGAEDGGASRQNGWGGFMIPIVNLRYRGERA